MSVSAREQSVQKYMGQNKSVNIGTQAVKCLLSAVS